MGYIINDCLSLLRFLVNRIIQKQNEALLAVYEFVGSSTKPMMVCAFFPLAFIHVHAKNYQMHGSSYVGIDDCRVSDLCWPV